MERRKTSKIGRAFGPSTIDWRFHFLIILLLILISKCLVPCGAARDERGESDCECDCDYDYDYEEEEEEEGEGEELPIDGSRSKGLSVAGHGLFPLRFLDKGVDRTLDRYFASEFGAHELGIGFPADPDKVETIRIPAGTHGGVIAQIPFRVPGTRKPHEFEVFIADIEERASEALHVGSGQMTMDIKFCSHAWGWSGGK